MDSKDNLRDLVKQIPLPMCTVNKEGKVEEANQLIGDVFLYDGIIGVDIFQLTGIKYDVLEKAAVESRQLTLSRNDKNFNLAVKKLADRFSKDKFLLCIYFMDNTRFIEIEKRYDDEKACMALVNIDNFDELTSNTGEANQLGVISEIDKKIRSWAATGQASVTRYKDHMYFLVFEKKFCRQQEKEKFPILDQVREIETDADFPITLSIGIGVKGESPKENDNYADQALDLALGRGGDQVVVKDGDRISYYGGKAQAVEKSNKGKSKIIGHALKRLIETSSKIFIMGHINPDMDAFGAALGVYRLSEPINKDTYIVIDNFNEALVNLYTEIKEEGEHNLINNKKALSLVDENSLVIVVDTHRPGRTECPELLNLAKKTVVIDHHRKGEDFLVHPTLTYAEPYASSTAELVTEILQYTIDRKEVSRLEAEALMAGIFVDTNRFSVKTGVRTLEAAAWLRRAGADPAAVKRFFQVDKESLIRRSKSVSEAYFDDRGIAYAICEGENVNAQIINSQVADQLLTARGIDYSFVAGKNQKGKTVVSARSIGEKNVQAIMEKFGGGGHLNTAGAQMDMEPEEAIEEIKDMLEEDIREEAVKKEN